jgi:hypothetical protein
VPEEKEKEKEKGKKEPDPKSVLWTNESVEKNKEAKKRKTGQG